MIRATKMSHNLFDKASSMYPARVPIWLITKNWFPTDSIRELPQRRSSQQLA